MEKKILGIPYAKATELNRGKASAYLKEVHDNNEDLLVMKNNEPYVVIVSMERYEKLIEMANRVEIYSQGEIMNGDR